MKRHYKSIEKAWKTLIINQIQASLPSRPRHNNRIQEYPMLPYIIYMYIRGVSIMGLALCAVPFIPRRHLQAAPQWSRLSAYNLAKRVGPEACTLLVPFQASTSLSRSEILCWLVTIQIPLANVSNVVNGLINTLLRNITQGVSAKAHMLHTLKCIIDLILIWYKHDVRNRWNKFMQDKQPHSKSSLHSQPQLY